MTRTRVTSSSPEALAPYLMHTLAEEDLNAPPPPPLSPEQRPGEDLRVLLTRVQHALDACSAQLRRNAEDFVASGRAHRARESLQVVLDATLVRVTIYKLVTASVRPNAKPSAYGTRGPGR